jgi:polyhydroxyalkanoate synthesis regulator phasin
MNNKTETQEKPKDPKKKISISLEFSDILDFFKKVGTQGKEAFTTIEQEIEKKILWLVNKGEITQEEADEISREFREKLKSKIGQLNKSIDSNLQKALKTLNIATTDDVRSLENRIDMLINKVDSLFKNKTSAGQAKSKPKTKKAKPTKTESPSE